MNIESKHDLNITLNMTRDSPQLAEIFMECFKEVSGGLQLSHKEGSFFRCASMDMDGRWDYDHKCFQQMIDRHCRMNAEVVGCIITECLNSTRMIHPAAVVPCLVYKTGLEVIHPVVMILTPLVGMICMNMESLGVIWNKP